MLSHPASLPNLVSTWPCLLPPDYSCVKTHGITYGPCYGLNVLQAQSLCGGIKVVNPLEMRPGGR
jgi:hypothetical protein